MPHFRWDDSSDSDAEAEEAVMEFESVPHPVRRRRCRLQLADPDPDHGEDGDDDRGEGAGVGGDVGAADIAEKALGGEKALRSGARGGSAPAYRIDGRSVAVSQAQNYARRLGVESSPGGGVGEDSCGGVHPLKPLNFQEWFMCFQVSKKGTQKEQKEERAREAKKRAAAVEAAEAAAGAAWAVLTGDGGDEESDGAAEGQRPEERSGGADEDDDDAAADGSRSDGAEEGQDAAADEGGPTGTGARPANMWFSFESSHVLSEGYAQKLRSKMLVPALAGAPPPRLPPRLDPDVRPTRAWRKMEAAFVRRASLTTFGRARTAAMRPWRLSSPSESRLRISATYV